MFATLLAAGAPYETPFLDWHALAPLIVLVGALAIALIVDSIGGQRQNGALPSVVGLGLLGSLVPIVTLAMHDDATRSLFGGGFVIDRFALLMAAFFVIVGYLTVLMSTHYIAEGDYYEGEYYFLLLASIIGMVFMSSARDLISIFVALELLSMPAYLLAAWRKRDRKGVEGGLKYYLMGVFASALMLYGMSLIFGGTGHTHLAEIREVMAGGFGAKPVATIGIVLTLVGFAFKVSAVPFHNWAPDTYEGSPTPITAFLSVASKAAGFVAILQLAFVGFVGQANVVRPMMFIMAVATMFVANFIAIRQTNVVRMLAYSSVAQAGFLLAPIAVIESAPGGVNEKIVSTVLLYLVAYAFMNMGAFAVVIAVARRTGSGEMDTWNGLFNFAPGLAATMAVFMFSLGGIPPMVGWFVKFQLFQSVINAGTASAYVMGVIMAINTVISMAYYLALVRRMFTEDTPEMDTSPVKVPMPLIAAMGICAIALIVLGFVPHLITDLADSAVLALGAGG